MIKKNNSQTELDAIKKNIPLERFAEPLEIANLATFLTKEEKLPLPRGQTAEKKKIVNLVKGCDSSAVIELIVEKGIDREDVIVFGIPCTGVINEKKLKKKLNGITSIDEVSKNIEAIENIIN